MLARIRRAQEAREGGFTLIELLVVMIIIGILAAIAIPVFLAQRAKARDTSTKADVSTAGKEIATYYVDNTGTLTATQAAAGGDITLKQGTTTVTTFKVSNGTALMNVVATADSSWCVAYKNDNGSQKYFKYSSATGLSTATSAGC